MVTQSLVLRQNLNTDLLHGLSPPTKTAFSSARPVPSPWRARGDSHVEPNPVMQDTAQATLTHNVYGQ